MRLSSLQHRVRVTACIAVFAAGLTSCRAASDQTIAEKVDLAGAGATFPYPLYRVWFADYGTKAGIRINYYSVGSTEGLRLLEEGQVDFGATDRPAAGKDTAAGPCARVAIPMATGSVGVAYNLPGALATIKMSADVLADIFSGRVRRWNDASIRAINPGVTIPSTPITVVHRGTGSGTSSAFVRYLSRSTHWTPTNAPDLPDVVWPVGVAAEGNEGVASTVKATLGAIGYVELSYARQNRLKVGAVQDSAGLFIEPAVTQGPYPIVTETWIVIDPHRVSEAKGRQLLAFARWALHEGAQSARSLEYAPLPPATVARYDSVIAKLRFGAATCPGKTPAL